MFYKEAEQASFSVSQIPHVCAGMKGVCNSTCAIMDATTIRRCPMDAHCGIIALGPKKYVEVYTLDDRFDLWLVERESRKHIGATDDLRKVKDIVGHYS